MSREVGDRMVAGWEVWQPVSVTVWVAETVTVTVETEEQY